MRLPPPLSLGWRAMPGISFLRQGPTGVRVGPGPSPPLALQPPTSALADMLTVIRDGVAEPDLCGRLDPTELARFHHSVGRLVAHGMVALDVVHDGNRLVTLSPRKRGFELPTCTPFEAPVELSRFAYLRRVDSDLVLTAPDAACDVVLVHPRAQAWVSACARPQAGEGAEPAERVALLSLLHALGLLEIAGGEEPEAMRTWEFHDRVFHRSTRAVDDYRARGATYRWRGAQDSPPVTRAAYAGTTYQLDRPLPRNPSQSLRNVMDTRRSSRDMAGEPVSTAEIGELLYRVGRTTEVLDGPEPLIRRPYPSGGSRHELEFYLAVRSCEGLNPDLYHYRGSDHSLVALNAPVVAAAMVAECAQSWARPDDPPQVLVVISSRLPRLAWKYEGIAYRLSLLNAGVAIANLCLVTTDMGLAGCAAGSGNPELFAAATGADTWDETSIAEFGFGRPGG